MAVYYARKNGNINATDVWATTPSGTAADLFSSFTSADTLLANGFTVTLNVSVTVLEVRTDTTGGATAGGSFMFSGSGVTLTANVIGGLGNNCVSFSTGANNGTIVGSVTGGATAGGGGAPVSHTSAGLLSIVGNVSGASAGNTQAVVMNGNGTLAVTGTVTAGPGSLAHGIAVNGPATVVVTGAVVGSASTSNAIGLAVASAGAAGATVTVIGTATAGSNSPGVEVGVSATVTVTRAVGNGFGNGSVGMTARVGVNNTVASSNVSVREIEYGALGQSPTAGPISIVDSVNNVALMYRVGTTKKTLVDVSASAGHPEPSNVRSGVSYANGNQTGTCAVPAAGSVALGVPVDNTVGTAALNPQDIWNFLTSNITIPNSIGERLKNCSTIASVGQQLSNASSS